MPPILLCSFAMGLFESSRQMPGHRRPKSNGKSARFMHYISSLICILGAYGVWKRNLKIWKILVIYLCFSIIDYVLYIIFVPETHKLLILPPEDRPFEFTPSGNIFYIIFLAFQSLILYYLFRRKHLFR